MTEPTSKESLQVPKLTAEQTKSPQTTQTGDFSTNVPKSGEVPQLTAEQKKRWEDFVRNKENYLFHEFDESIALSKVEAHLATELALQRREYEELINQLIILLHRKTNGRMNFTEKDLSGISYEIRLKLQLSYEALLQKGQSI